MSTLVISGLVVERAGRPVVRGVDLEIASGEIVALLGPNGAGRTTTIEAIAGLLSPAAGTIGIVGGPSLTGARPEAVRAAGVATVLTNHRVLGDLTVLDNLKVAAGRRGADRDRRVAQALTTFGELGDHLGRPARQLSGGQQQMLALGQALVREPDFLLIDEMSHGLAPVVVSRLLGVLRTVADSGVGILLVEQFATVALRLADRACVMARGSIVHAAPADVYVADQELLHRLYLGVDVPSV